MSAFGGALLLLAALTSNMPAPAWASSPSDSTRRPVSELPLASPEPYLTAAGRRIGDTLVVVLEARQARWRPQGTRAVELPVFVFAEPGKQARVPGPMLRVSEGGVVRITLRNTLAKRLVVRGLVPRPTELLQDSIVVRAGADTTITFPAGAAGSYYYWARTTPTVRHRTDPIPDWMYGGEAEEGPFVGALIVDPRGIAPDPRERTFVITRWLDENLPGLNAAIAWKLMVNGGSYPNTESLGYTVGDSVRWRVINATLTSHPMHLHGFYFRVTGKGTAGSHHDIPDSAQRLVVTELMAAGETMEMTWVPERPGNWLFHCHLTGHMSGDQRLPASTQHAAHDARDAHAEHEMAGLVLGITVRARGGRTASAEERAAAGARSRYTSERAIRLLAQRRENVFGTAPGFAFVQQQGASAPVSDSITQPGTTLLLRRGEPTRISVVNRLPTSLSVHWHGMELDSWFDGVGGFSGMGSRTRARIPPADSFVVRYTPPRAGTFMFHTHDEAGAELSSGLYGALLVLDDPATYDPQRDHVVLMAASGPSDSGVVAINGRRLPAPLMMEPGVAHRLRFASIPSNERVDVSLVQLGADTVEVVQHWHVLAVDGADVSPTQQAPARAQRRMAAGMTMDVSFVLPAEGRFAVRVRMLAYEASGMPGSIVMIPLVREARR